MLHRGWKKTNRVIKGRNEVTRGRKISNQSSLKFPLMLEEGKNKRDNNSCFPAENQTSLVLAG